MFLFSRKTSLVIWTLTILFLSIGFHVVVSRQYMDVQSEAGIQTTRKLCFENADRCVSLKIKRSTRQDLS